MSNHTNLQPVIEEKAITAFKEILEKSRSHSESELIGLDRAGWRELCPDEEFWHFVHEDFPGGEVRWVIGRNEKVWWHTY